MTFEMLAWMLIILAGADAAVTAFLVTRDSREPAFRERATVSIILTVAAVLWSILAIGYLLDIPLGVFGTALLFGGLLLISVPQLIWFVAYWRGAFR